MLLIYNLLFCPIQWKWRPMWNREFGAHTRHELRKDFRMDFSCHWTEFRSNQNGIWWKMGKNYCFLFDQTKETDSAKDFGLNTKIYNAIELNSIEIFPFLRIDDEERSKKPINVWPIKSIVLVIWPISFMPNEIWS